MKLRFKRLNRDARIPQYSHDGDSGMDIRSIVNAWIMPGCVLKIPTGIAAEIPAGYELQVRPRSGLSSKGVVCILGTVDSNYRGEIGIVLHNASGMPFGVEVGDRIAQIVLCRVETADIEECGQDEELGDTVRGADGFGSTGVK